MATVNAAREEFEAAKTAALRAAGKVPKEAVTRVFVILLDILIVVLLEKTTHEPELRSAAVTDGQERAGSNGKGPKPNQQMGDNHQPHKQPAQDHRRGDGRGLRRRRRRPRRSGAPRPL